MRSKSPAIVFGERFHRDKWEKQVKTEKKCCVFKQKQIRVDVQRPLKQRYVFVEEFF